MPDRKWDRARLIKLLALLGSHSDGEVLAAARKITEFLHNEELDWDAVITLADGGPLKLASLYAAERRRRMQAEQAAVQWRDIARSRSAPASAEPLQTGPPAAAAARPGPTPGPVPQASATAASVIEADRAFASGHPVLNLLLASGLSGSQRTRVEAIASWFRATGQLTARELAELTALHTSL